MTESLPNPREPSRSFWSCGHEAGAICAECYRELAQRATALAAEVERLRTAGLNEVAEGCKLYAEITALKATNEGLRASLVAVKASRMLKVAHNIAGRALEREPA